MGNAARAAGEIILFGIDVFITGTDAAGFRDGTREGTSVSFYAVSLTDNTTVAFVPIVGSKANARLVTTR